MKAFSFHIKLSVVLLLMSLLACRTSNKLQEGEYLLTQNVIKINNKNIDKDELHAYIKQNPNKKILGVLRFHLSVYQFADRLLKDRKEIKKRKAIKRVNRKERKGKVINKEREQKREERSLKDGLKNTIGEAPVILDTTLTNKTVKQFNLYLNNKGYFNSKVYKSITYKKRKKAVVKYHIEATKPYTIRKINYSIEDNLLNKIIKSDTLNCLIKYGNNYDVDVLQSERERLTKKLKDNGYYYFSKEFIFFKIDSALNNKQVDISIDVKKPVLKIKEYPDSVITANHKRYKINNIYVYPDYKTLQADSIPYDTLIVNTLQRSIKDSNRYYFLFKNKLRFKPRTITQSIFFKEGDYFEQKAVTQTYQRLSDLRNFKFINIQFVDITNDSISNKSNTPLLDCKIQLTRAPIHSFSVETEGTNSAGNLGIAGNVVYQNKNVFKGAEILSLKVKGAMEVQEVSGKTDENEVIGSFLPFNTIETGAEASMNIPKFLIPIRQERFPKYFRPQTNINTGLNYQKRPDYTRYITNISFGYNWKESIYKTHMLNPLEVNSVNIDHDSSFAAKIESLRDKKIQYSYQDHLITAIRYSFIYNNQDINKIKNFVYFRANAEIAGNPINVFRKEQKSYTLFNIKYAQYTKISADFRFYNVINPKNTIVYRTMVGYGIPYGNLVVLPFEKSFFSGGANSIRAWKLRSLGPGSYRAVTDNFDRTGDINIEANIEYRFPLYGVLQGAAFVDAGNIWLKNESTDFLGGVFDFNNFLSEIAVGAGLGARFDFSFFVIRLDAAVPMKDPAKLKKDRWVLKNTKMKDINYNLGIGYPF